MFALNAQATIQIEVTVNYIVNDKKCIVTDQLPGTNPNGMQQHMVCLLCAQRW